MNLAGDSNLCPLFARVGNPENFNMVNFRLYRTSERLDTDVDDQGEEEY
jgi:hypothetical protein